MPLEVAIGCLEIIIRLHGTLCVVSNLAVFHFGKPGWRSGHQSHLPPLLQMLYVD